MKALRNHRQGVPDPDWPSLATFRKAVAAAVDATPPRKKGVDPDRASATKKRSAPTPDQERR